MNTTNQLLYIPADKLKTHPKNMRREYPTADVKSLADSMRARMKRKQHPIIHPLVITPNGQAGHFYVVDGNMRLAAARVLGKQCPPLKCELTQESEAEQALTMVITEAHRSSVDPIAKAKHFQALIDQHGYTAQRIAEETGMSVTLVYDVLLLLKLDAEIQDLISRKELRKDPRVVRALLSIPDADARVAIAKRMASRHASILVIVNTCAKYLMHVQAEQERAERAKLGPLAPAVECALKRSRGRPQNVVTVPWHNVRAAVRQTCDACNIREETLAGVAEPAWELISHASGATCQACNLPKVARFCNECPTVDLLKHIINLSGVPS